MRVLLYSAHYYPEPIGIAPLMTELAEGLVNRGHKVRVVTAMPCYPERKIYPGYQGQLYKREVRNGVEIDRCFVASRPKPGLVTRTILEGSFAILSVIKAITGWRPDIILSTIPSFPACLSVALAKAFHRCPTVLALQDMQNDTNFGFLHSLGRSNSGTGTVGWDKSHETIGIEG